MKSTISTKLQERCDSLCELCSTEKASTAYAVSPKNNDKIENEVIQYDQIVAVPDIYTNNMDDLLDYNSGKFYISYEPKEQTTYLWYSDKYLCNAFFCCNKNNDITKNTKFIFIKNECRSY